MNLNKHLFGGDVDRLSVDRAIAEFRAGRPVVIKAGKTAFLACPVDGLNAAAALALDGMSAGAARLALSGPRLNRLLPSGDERAEKGGAIALPSVKLGPVQTLSTAREARLDAPVLALAPGETEALLLSHYAAILPALIIAPVDAQTLDYLPAARVAATAIASYSRKKSASLKIVSRAPVPLEGAKRAEMVVFRGGEGLRDQAAVIIGTPDFDEPVTVRLHSACLTGDLFGSLKCDCGDQLRMTARYMADHNGGVILYLDQEGRGNGLSNKIKAYALQADGLDTYDADAVLGFDHDQRGFDFAADMLMQLGIARVNIMTNNPVKIEALERAGLDVVSQQRINGRSTLENIDYLRTKRDRAGHVIDAALALDTASCPHKG